MPEQLQVFSDRQQPEPPAARHQVKLLQLLQDWMVIDPPEASTTYDQQKEELIEGLGRPDNT